MANTEEYIPRLNGGVIRSAAELHAAYQKQREEDKKSIHNIRECPCKSCCKERKKRRQEADAYHRASVPVPYYLRGF